MGEIIVGIDIGTSKVCTLIGTINKSNQVEIIGEGMCVCSGVKKGVIVDIESTSSSIRSSVEQAEAMANLKVGSAYVNIIGTHVTVVNGRGSVQVSNENREITAKDVDRVLNSSGDVEVPEDRQVIDIIPRQYIIDGYDEILDPIGMVGVRLESDTEVILGKITSVQNILKSMERANIKVDGFVVESLAVSETVLAPEEKEMGVILIDIGGNVTDISAFKNKKLVFYDSIPVGGDHITSDISIGLKIPYPEAEKIKREYELALTSLIKNDHEITVNDINDGKRKTIRISGVVEIIEARVQEIFSLCRKRLENSGAFENYPGGVVLVGGGISYVDGNIQLAQEEFNTPVRVISCKNLGISKPESATAVGLVRYISNHRKKSNQVSETKHWKQKGNEKKTGFFKKISRLFIDLF